MKAQIMNTVVNDSKHHANGFSYIFFKNEAGNSYRTCVDPTMRNYKNWEKYLVGKEGTWLYGLQIKVIKGKPLIDADSIISEEPEAPIVEKVISEKIVEVDLKTALFHIQECRKILEGTEKN